MNWKYFLRDWSDEVMDYIPSLRKLMDFYGDEIDAIENRYFGYPPATIGEIEKVENKLGIKLPTSYKNFLLVSNGWLNLFFDEESINLLPVSEIDLLSRLEPVSYKIITQDKIDISEENYRNSVFDEKDRSILANEIRISDLTQCLAISKVVSCGLYIMNPGYSPSIQEYETCVYLFRGDNNRCSSFESLMLAERKRCLNSIKYLTKG